jgi:hypothetical protein
MPGSLPSKHVSEKQFPKVYAWINRFNGVLKEAKANSPPIQLKSSEAHDFILSSNYTEHVSDTKFEPDPTGLEFGDIVEVFPTDSGSRHKDRGRLVKLTMNEIVIEVETKIRQEKVRLHYPRLGFRVAKVSIGVQETARL